MALAMADAAPCMAMRGTAVAASNGNRKGKGDLEVAYGDVRSYAGIACVNECHVVPSVSGLGGMRALPPVILDDRRGYVFRDGASHRFVWKGGVGQFRAGHPEARICAVNLAASNGKRFMPLTAAEQAQFLRLASLETTVDDARSAGITMGCIGCGGTHSTMRLSGAVGYLFDEMFVDGGCIWAHDYRHTARLQFLEWQANSSRLTPRIQPVVPIVRDEFWAARPMT